MKIIDKWQQLEIKVNDKGRNQRFAGVASFPKRREVFEHTINSVAPQLDQLFVYLNDYLDIPDYLNRDNITVFRSQDFKDLSATGKVFALGKLPPCYYLTIDDDIVYPDDYVKKMVECSAKYKDKFAVTVHSSIFAEPLEWYYERFTFFPMLHACPSDKIATLAGSGTFCFHTDNLKTDFLDFYPRVMVDLQFSILARQQHIPIVSIKRKRGWLKVTDREGLWQQFKEDLTKPHTRWATHYAPWDFQSFKEFVIPAYENIFGHLSSEIIKRYNLDNSFIVAAQNNIIPEEWQPTVVYYKSRLSYLDTIMEYKQDEIRKIEKIIFEKQHIKKQLMNSTGYTLGNKMILSAKRPYYIFLLPLYLVSMILRKVGFHQKRTNGNVEVVKDKLCGQITEKENELALSSKYLLELKNKNNQLDTKIHNIQQSTSMVVGSYIADMTRKHRTLPYNLFKIPFFMAGQLFKWIKQRFS